MSEINVLHNMWQAQAKNEIFLLSDLFNFLHVLDYFHVVGFSLTFLLQSMVLKMWVVYRHIQVFWGVFFLVE